jgi:hypothetical protein
MGFKKTSETIAISFSVAEVAPGVYQEDEIALQLDVLNNEIFVVLAVDLNTQLPEAIVATNTSVKASVASTASLTMQSLANTNVLAVSRDSIQAAGFVDGGCAFSRGATETYTGDIDYIGLIATNNFHVGILGAGNAGTKTVNGRLWGYRAKADSSTYAALVQSEVLSA